jgi:hypothetical protein
MASQQEVLDNKRRGT